MSSSGLQFIERAAMGKPKGLLVLLHGVGASEQSLATLAAEQDPALAVILPRGPVALGVRQYGWFEVRFTPQGTVINPQQAEGSRRQLIGFVAEQQQRLGVQAAQTVIAGFSQGGILSASVALTSPASVAGFAILSGRILPEIEALIPADVGLSPLVALVSHGRNDSKLPFSLAERSIARLGHHGVMHELKAYDEDHILSPAMRKDFREWVQQRIG